MNRDEADVTADRLASFHLRMLGFPAVTTADAKPIAGLGPGKPLALLVYLAVRREARRDELVDLLWGEVNEANARNAFRQALHRLRSALGEALIPMDRDRVELGADHLLQTDRDTLIDALDRGDVAEAVQLYRADFLEDFELGEPVFDAWVDAERTRLRTRFHVALQKGAEAALASGRWLEGLQYVQRLTALAPFEEAAALLEANLLIAAGRRAEASASLRNFAHSIREQLDLQPSPRVNELMARIERLEPGREASVAKARTETPFVGREPELGQLMSLIRSLTAEEGATLFIEGPAGIGKTRLVAELLARAKGFGPLLVLRGRELPLGSALPYASVAEALRNAVRAPGVAGTSRHLLAEAARILPDLRDAFDLPEQGPVDAEGGRLRFFEGVAALLDSAAYEKPVCLVLDDMHHASSSTLDLVGYLSVRLRSSPVLLLLLYRDGEGSAALDRLRSASDGAIVESGGAATLHLGPLGTVDLQRLVESIGATRGVEGQLDLERIAAAAAGNPLRAIELSRRALNGELPSAVPALLRDILWQRLQKLVPSQRRLFFAAALIQRRCPLRLLASAAHLSELAAFEAAGALEDSGLLSAEDDGYVIAHDFTTAFVVEASGLAGRAMLAGWAADALAGERPAPAAELANLYFIAGQQAAAFAHARRAVYEAAALGSTPEVHRLLALALAVAPDSAARSQVEAMLAAFGEGRRLLHDSPQRSGDGPATPVDLPTGHRTARESPASPAPATVLMVPKRSVFTPRFVALVLASIGVSAAALAWSESRRTPPGRLTLSDSLLVVERGTERSGSVSVVTGPLALLPGVALPTFSMPELPPAIQRLSLPWIRPSLAPVRRLAAIERMTETGTDVYLVSGDTMNPVPVAAGGGMDAVLGWAPDGGSLLIRRSKVLQDGAFDADLWAYGVAGGRVVSVTPVDTSSARSVEEAAWSPDGRRIAWVSQVGSHQRDVFVSKADGSGMVNATDNPGEDYHISWSPDGNLLAFTSARDGNPDLFAIEFEADARRLWRLTRTPDEEDRAVFSPDQRFVAFQSTRGGDAAVYVMPALGGTPTRATPAGRQYSIAGWQGRAVPAYVDRLRIIGSTQAGAGDSLVLSVFGADRDGNPRATESVTMRLAEGNAAWLRPLAPADSSRGGGSVFVVGGLRPGVVRVIAAIPGWRADTLAIEVSDAGRLSLSDDFGNGISRERWISLGEPRPAAGRTADGNPAFFPRGDLQWQSGILSRRSISLRDSVEVSAEFGAPYARRPFAAALLNLALVRDQPSDSIDASAPQLTDVVAIAWDGEASRFTYSVGPESKSDPESSLGGASTHVVRIVIGTGGRVSFFVDGTVRWTSSLRYLGQSGEISARLWLGGRATVDQAFMRNLQVRGPR